MRFRCNLPSCGTFPRGFEFEDNSGECPKCGAKGPPVVAPLIDVHLMVMDRKGPIQGKLGRQYVACQPQRAYLCRHPNDPFSATDDVECVSCPKCIRTPQFREQAARVEALAPLLESAGRVTVDFGGDVPAKG